ncbi:MAG: MATE family efflux transporter [Clostridiales bacterium]|nr:MATE family efflux transporter [Clostridiales bacterium]
MENKPDSIAKNANAVMMAEEPVGRLLWKFSLPAALGVIISLLYNLADVAFVGQGVDAIAVGALTLAGSFMMAVTAVSNLFGMGAANLISVKLGQGKPDEAQSALTHSFVLLLASAAIITLLGVLFLEPLLMLFGAVPGTRSMAYAKDYTLIILFGTVPNMVSFGLSHGTRAQGFKTATMLIMVVGAAINLVLDPLFIFVFRWGVSGAAWATIIAQSVSMLIGLYYTFFKKNALHISLKAFRFLWKTVKLILTFGLSQFAVQFASTLISAVYNVSMNQYGPAYFGIAAGGDMALSAFGVLIKIQQTALMPIMGITQGAQPILGFNYGAKKYGRVRKTIQLAALSATVICLVGFTVAELFPALVTHVISSSISGDMLDFCVWILRISLITLPIVGFQIVSANYFTVIGKMKQSLFLTLSRQCLFLIPLVLVLGNRMGLEGVIIAGPVSDGLSFLITGLLVTKEVRKLRKLEKNILTGAV